MKIISMLMWCSLFSLLDSSFASYLTIFQMTMFVPFFLNNHSPVHLLDSVALFFFLIGTVVLNLCLVSTLMIRFSTAFGGREMLLVMGMNLFTSISFLTSSYLIFYLMFEVTFILMFYHVMKFGLKTERKISSYYMFFFTLISSLPLLIYLFVFAGNFKSYEMSSDTPWTKYWWIFLMLVFLVKVPMFGVHMWLPKAHVEAPLSGSIFLSGILLKIGFYGIFRFFQVSKLIMVSYTSFLLSTGWLSSLVMTLVCLRQFDIKSTVAYSSVVHMGMAVSGLFACSYTSSKAVYLMCFSHGLSSPLMFYVLYMFYNNYNTRSILLLKGSNNSHPVKSIVVFLATVSAMGVPPLASFFSEIMLNIGVLSFSFLFITPSLLLFFFSGIYMIYFFVFFFHGDTLYKEVSNILQSDLLSGVFTILMIFTLPFIS